MTDAARLQELEDREAIRQIFVDYARYLDNYDHAGYASLFARKGVFGGATGPEAIKEQMAQYVERVGAAKREGKFHDAVHIMNNHDIKISGDTAKVDVTWCYMTVDADKVPTVFQMGHYVDDVVREDGVWKLTSHNINRLMGRAQLEAPHPSRLDDTRARLQTLEDKEAIRQIFTDYARYLDSGNFEGYASLFARNGFMKASLGEAVGPEAILELLNKYRTASKGRSFPKAFHIVNNHDITLDGDNGKADVRWFYLTTDPDGVPMIHQGGRYVDAVVRENGVWKLVSHDIERVFGRAPFDPPPVTRLDRIEQRLQDVEDREAINRLFVKAQDCIDERDIKAYAALFTEDGEWGGIIGRVVGPQEIEQLLSKALQPWDNERDRSYHLVLDSVIDLDGDEAAAVSRWAYVTRGEGDKPLVQVLGRYVDKLRRTPDGWRFAGRDSYADIPHFQPK